MAGTAEKNEACISCCKCSLEYLSAACNRTPLCVDWGRNGWVAYGACHSIALWLPKVRYLFIYFYFILFATLITKNIGKEEEEEKKRSGEET